MPKLFDLTGKTALITGSSRGIGKAIAMAMVDAGARVVISSRKLDACEAVAAEINDAGGEAMALPCNVSDRDSLRTLVGEVIDANVAKAPEGRADEAILEMKELGDNVFYGG